MKPTFNQLKKHLFFGILAIVGFIPQLCYAQPDYNFGTGTLIGGTGTYRSVNSQYRFPNIKAGVDGIVTIKAIVNATLDSVDRNGIGHREAFQPSVTVNANSVGYVEFEFRFVNTGTTTLVNQSVIDVTSIDVDGSSPVTDPSYIIYEFDEYNFSPVTSSVQFSYTGGQLTFSTSGNWKRGMNTGGEEYTSVDTTAKEVMFTLTAENTSTFLVRMGADNRNASNSLRLRSLYFKEFIYPNTTTLPVKLVSFSAVLYNNMANLNWTTASEINVSHFIIEKSFDGTNFSEAGHVFAVGNSNQKVNYSFKDDVSNVTAGQVFYRIRSVDIDANYEYSSVRVIRIHDKTENSITITTYPNPVINELRVSIPDKWQNKKVVYELYNEKGQTVKKMETAKSDQTETLNVTSLAPGFYVVRVSCNGETAQQKIIKQ